MGKKGDALRAAKKTESRFTITREWLENHDREVLAAHKESVMKTCMEELQRKADEQYAEMNEALKFEREEIAREWAERENEFKNGGFNDNFFNMMQYLLSISARVLVEHYKWSPIKKGREWDMRYRLNRFADQIVDEISKISHDSSADIRKYADETYELYGIRFVKGEEHGN